jgi:hypothetical protein
MPEADAFARRLEVEMNKTWDDDVRAVRAQAAVVRTIIDQMNRHSDTRREIADLKAQAVEESARLVSHIQSLLDRLADELGMALGPRACH